MLPAASSDDHGCDLGNIATDSTHGEPGISTG